jgi:hypothetical protein
MQMSSAITCFVFYLFIKTHPLILTVAASKYILYLSSPPYTHYYHSSSSQIGKSGWNIIDPLK